MKNELIFSKKWFTLDKYYFKILTIITDLADNTNTFKGTLSDFCENLSIQKSTGNKNKIKAALDYLERNNYISMSVDKKNYTVTLIDISDNQNHLIRLKKPWYKQLRSTKTETSWENLLKIFLILLEVSKVPDNIVTYKQIGKLTGCSISTVSRAVESIASMRFGRFGFGISAKTIKKKCEETYITIGTIFEQGLWFK